MEKQFIRCNRCGANLRVPQNAGLLSVTCPRCRNVFYFDSSISQYQGQETDSHTKPTKKIRPLWKIIIVIVIIVGISAIGLSQYGNSEPTANNTDFNQNTDLEQNAEDVANGLIKSTDSSIRSQPATEGLIYEMNSTNNGYVVTGSYSPIVGELVIPATYNGYPVTAIEDGAFKEYTGITELYTGDNVESIDGFNWCSGLTSVEFGDNTKKIIGFNLCSDLTSVTFPDKAIKVSGFNYCTKLENVKFGESIQSVSGFSACTSLRTIVFPDSITSASGFEYCTGLESVYIGASLVNCTHFTGCGAIISITISNDNPKYYTSGNCLMDKATNEILFANGNSTIPEGVTILCGFTEQSDMVDYVIPDGITTIAAYAFSGCANLTSVSIPLSVEKIEISAFINCISLEDIYYSGTITQWDEMERVGEHYGNWYGSLTAPFVVHCTDGDLQYYKSALVGGYTIIE